jgi:disulfide bond formation protein DsbB
MEPKGKAVVTLLMAWVVASVATFGSLFLSEVMKYPPCTLCWYQRICMYPLMLIFLMGLFPVSKVVVKFSMPLVILGMAISFYHNLLYYQILPESASPCREGISCTTVFIEWFGFITIPLLSFSAFLLILILLVSTRWILKHEK